jgi:hypothetical protein
MLAGWQDDCSGASGTGGSRCFAVWAANIITLRAVHYAWLRPVSFYPEKRPRSPCQQCLGHFSLGWL